MGNITMREIAKSLGISVAAVSMALGNRQGVSEETRQKVMDEAERLGYSIKKSPPRKKICVINTDYWNLSHVDANQMNFYSEMSHSLYHGIEHAAKAAGYDVEFRHGANKEQQDNTPNISADGILLLISGGNEARLEEYLSWGLPVLALGNGFPKSHVNTVAYDNSGAGRKAVEVLYNLGHRRIGYLQVNDFMYNYVERREGYYSGLREYGLEPAEQFVFGEREWNASTDIYEKMSKWFSDTQPTATAYISNNDLIAATAMRVFREHGLKIGEDVSIIGFDDQFFAAVSDPPLATFKLKEAALGRIAAERLISVIESPDDTCSHLFICTEFIERESICKIKTT